MEKTPQYRFSRGDNGFITFDSKGYIVEAKGFSFLMWCDTPDIDKYLIGKHVDELAQMLEKKAVNRNMYLEFEAYVHLELLKKMLKDIKK